MSKTKKKKPIPGELTEIYQEGTVVIDSMTPDVFDDIARQFHNSPAMRFELMQTLMMLAMRSAQVKDTEGNRIFREAFGHLAIVSTACKSKATGKE